MDTLASMRAVVAESRRVVDAVEPDQLTNATPCADWDVRAVINHITGGASMFSECVEHGAIADADLGRLMTTDLLGEDYRRAYAAAAERALAAFDVPGALDKTVTLPFGAMPAAVALQIAVFDLAVHSLDIACGAGLALDLDPAVVDAAWDAAQGMLSDDLRASGMFGAAQEVPAGASRAEQLMAFSGRKL